MPPRELSCWEKRSAAPPLPPPTRRQPPGGDGRVAARADPLRVKVPGRGLGHAAVPAFRSPWLKTTSKGLFVHARRPPKVSQGRGGEELLTDSCRGTQNGTAANISNAASCCPQRARTGLIVASMLWPERNTCHLPLTVHRPELPMSPLRTPGAQAPREEELQPCGSRRWADRRELGRLGGLAQGN